jgi:hypothetical protein
VCAEQVYLYTETFVWTDEWRQALACASDEVGGYLLVVVEVAEGVVGHLRLFPPWYGAKGRHVGEVGLALVEPWREQGIGAALLAYALDWTRVAGFHKVIASVAATNQRALRLFARFGFVEEGRRARQLWLAGQYVDEVLLGWFVGEQASPSIRLERAGGFHVRSGL